MDARLVDPLRLGRGVLARWQALEHVPEGVLRGLVRSGELVVVRHGVLADGTSLRAADPAARALLEARAEQTVRRRDEVVTGPTAAAVHGLPFRGRVPSRARSALPREVGERPREDRPRTWLPDDHITLVEGLPVTTVARTVVDVARTRPFAFAVVTADAALARGCTRPELEDALAQCRRFPGTRSARRVLSFADARSESPLESLGRARFDEEGLPPPELQVEMGTADRGIRVDHLSREQRTVGEADGLHTTTSRSCVRRSSARTSCTPGPRSRPLRLGRGPAEAEPDGRALPQGVPPRPAPCRLTGPAPAAHWPTTPLEPRAAGPETNGSDGVVADHPAGTASCRARDERSGRDSRGAPARGGPRTPRR